MPEQSQLSEILANPVADVLVDLLGRTIEYLTNEGTWEDVYFVGFDSIGPTTIGQPCAEVLPPRDTTFGKRWHEANKPTLNLFPEIIKDPQPSPIKVFDLSRVRLKAIGTEPIKTIEA